jgi:trk system potassium uptake protein TrkH
VNFAVIQWVMGVLLMLFSTTMLPPMVVSLIYDDGSIHAFVKATLVTLSAGVLVWLPVRSARHRDQNLRLREGFVIVTAFWFGLRRLRRPPAHAGRADELHGRRLRVDLGLYDDRRDCAHRHRRAAAGAGLLPQPAPLLRRHGNHRPRGGDPSDAGHRRHAALPRRDPGPVKDTKLTPRITETAKYLWIAYVGINVLCMLAYWSAGMDLFDAIVHAFGSIATGGFSSHDESFGYFHNRLLEAIGVFFMFVGGVNFSLHFVAFGRGGRLGTTCSTRSSGPTSRCWRA